MKPETILEADGTATIDCGAVRFEWADDVFGQPLRPAWEVRLFVRVDPGDAIDFDVRGYRDASDLAPEIGWSGAAWFRSILPKLARRLDGEAGAYVAKNRARWLALAERTRAARLARSA